MGLAEAPFRKRDESDTALIMRGFWNWLEDAALCVWALLYWNARKSRYVFGRRRGRCPCQDPSDFGATGRAHCDASLHLNNPLRFRHVCPLVVPGPAGKGAFCSVSAGEVRPFWGRALMVFGGVAVILYIAGTTVFFTGMRVTGVKSLVWHQVVWPGAWGEIPHERSKVFFKHAIEACAGRDYRDAYRSMATAIELDPHNYQARLLMAQYTEFAGEFLTGDQLFKDLLREFPEARERTAITVHDTLLSMGRYNALAVHCLHMAAGAGADPSAWTGSLILAMHLGRLGPAFIAAQKAGLSKLEPDARRLAQAEASLVVGDVTTSLAGLRQVFTPPVNGNLVMQQIRMFLRAGAPADAEVAWTVNGRGLDAFDRGLARCWIDRDLGYPALAVLEFSALADRPYSEHSLDKLVATLVMQPDLEAYRHLHERVLRGPEVITLQTAGEMWLGALVCHAEKERDYWIRACSERFQMDYPPISAITFTSTDQLRTDTVPFLVNIGVFSRETITSLYWRVGIAAGNRHDENLRTPSR